jgi:hypothetical protein
MAKTLDDLTDEEYDRIMEERNRVKKEAVVGTVIGRIPRTMHRNTRDYVREWLNTWQYDDIMKLLEIYNPQPVAARDEDEPLINLAGLTARATPEPATQW